MTLMMAKNHIARTWGPRPEYALWLYTQVVRPKALYGSIVWYHALHKQMLRDKLNSLQRLGMVCISGVRNSSPTASLEVIFNLPPLDLKIRETALLTAHRVGVKQLWQPSHSSKQGGGHIHNLLKDMPLGLQNVVMDRAPFLRTWDRNFKVTIDDGKDPCERKEWNVYTDGSRINGHSVK
jgi:hypothetical protein